MPSSVTQLSCPRCSRTHDHRKPQTLCDCGTPLLVDYDLDAVSAAVSPGDLAARPADMWRYRELLPVEGEPVSLGEGMTPLFPVERLGKQLGLDLWLKD